MAIGVALGGIGIASASTMGGGAGAIASDPSGPASPDAGTPGSYNGGVVQAGQGLSAEAAASAVLKGLAGTPVQSVEVVPAPAQGQPYTAPWVSTRIASSALPGKDAGGTVDSIWFGALAQGAVADRMRTSESTTAKVIGGGEIVTADTNGDSTARPLGTGSVLGGQVFKSPGDRELKTRVQDVADRFGLSISSLELLHPLESALSVTFVVPDSLKPTWTIDDLRSALDGTPRSVEGTLITLKSPDGTPLLVNGAAYRTGSGALWFAPGEDVRFGAVHGALLPKPAGFN
jgi:hypothetical protein